AGPGLVGSRLARGRTLEQLGDDPWSGAGILERHVEVPNPPAEMPFHVFLRRHRAVAKPALTAESNLVVFEDLESWNSGGTLREGFIAPRCQSRPSGSRRH